jgi:hypothetical protein
MDSNILARSFAYCKGFVDGYESGISNNPYDGASPCYDEKLRHLHYRTGYDAGVSEYCRDTHPEDENA